jgi:hypothetical protein
VDSTRLLEFWLHPRSRNKTTGNSFFIMRYYLSSKELRFLIGTPARIENLRSSPGQLLITLPAQRFAFQAILSSTG